MINILFNIERISRERKHSPQQRLMFRHRESLGYVNKSRNWLHSGSHHAAQNIAFMYSLLESCKLNNINFGVYIEDILTRIMKGEAIDNTFLPNQWVARTPETGTQTA